VAVVQCHVSFIDPHGVNHSVLVDARSIMEAVAIAVAAMRQDELACYIPGPATTFKVEVVRKPVEHLVRYGQVQEWLAAEGWNAP
jgi:hypothetical protein